MQGVGSQIDADMQILLEQPEVLIASPEWGSRLGVISSAFFIKR